MPRDVFLKAQKVIGERRVDFTEAEMLSRLRRTVMRKGRLSPAIINEAAGLPCVKTYMDHFGSLRKAYGLIDYISKRDCNYIDSLQQSAGAFLMHLRRNSPINSNRHPIVLSSMVAQTLFSSDSESISLLQARWRAGNFRAALVHQTPSSHAGGMDDRDQIWGNAVKLCLTIFCSERRT
jgi:hypothetical protein